MLIVGFLDFVTIVGQQCLDSTGVTNDAHGRQDSARTLTGHVLEYEQELQLASY